MGSFIQVEGSFVLALKISPLSVDDFPVLENAVTDKALSVFDRESTRNDLTLSSPKAVAISFCVT
jgi:hypothetical protein